MIAYQFPQVNVCTSDFGLFRKELLWPPSEVQEFDSWHEHKYLSTPLMWPYRGPRPTQYYIKMKTKAVSLKRPGCETDI
jgi:hypothetical protein